MTDKAVIQGSYADLKFLKTRSICQLIIELPIEKAQEAIDAFGVPNYGEEVPVAIARLQSQPEAESYADEAEGLVDNPSFWAFLVDSGKASHRSSDDARRAIYRICHDTWNKDSRYNMIECDLTVGTPEGEAFGDLLAEYNKWKSKEQESTD